MSFRTFVCFSFLFLSKLAQGFILPHFLSCRHSPRQNCISPPRIQALTLQSSNDLKRSEPEPKPLDNDFDAHIGEDAELVRQLAWDQFNELKDTKGDLLSIEKFVAWEDIQDVLDGGNVDRETLDIIFKECNVVGGYMNFDQWLEVVDLVNQVTLALDDSDQGTDSDASNWTMFNEDLSDTEVDPEKVAQMLASLGIKKA